MIDSRNKPNKEQNSISILEKLNISQKKISIHDKSTKSAVECIRGMIA